MSYILEALKKAEAERERERGRVPDLNSQAGPVPWLQAPRSRERSPLPLMAVAALALAGAAALWWLLRPAAQPQGPVDTVPAGTLAGAPAAAVRAASPQPAAADDRAGLPATSSTLPVAPQGDAAAPAQAPAPRTSAQQIPAPQSSAWQAPIARQPGDGAALRRPSADRVPEAITPPAPDSAPLRRDTPLAHTPATSVQAGSRGLESAPTAPAKPASPRVLPLRELPPSVQGELPQLSIGGAMYSEDAASRLLIINGQVFHEGDEVQKGLRLEHIQLKSAVLSYRGYRFVVDY